MIRPARKTDQPAVAQLFGALGLTTPQLAPRDALVAERDGAVRGYVQFHTLGEVGYVRHLAISPPARAWVGLELMLGAAAALRRAGVREWHLDARPDAHATQVCEELGMSVEHRSTALRFPWARLPELPAEPARAIPVAAAEDDDVERALGLLGGQIAMARARAPVALHQLRDASCAAVGFAALDAAGVRLFRVARPALAAALLASLRTHASGSHVALVIDDHPALAALLLAHGAELRLELVHYAGPLPPNGRGC